MPNQKQIDAAKIREDRESTALRENLKKRKKQQQARAACVVVLPQKQKED